jgi:outer membrane murein-binding lipoprotein Lpp
MYFMGELSSNHQSPGPQKGSVSKLAVAATVISGLAVAGCITLALWDNNLTTQVSALTTENAALKKTTQVLTNQQKDTEALLKRVRLAANLSAMSHVLEQTSIVTDDFILEKATFDVTEDDRLKGVLLNVNNQPDVMFGIYQGKGKYNIASSALIAKSEEIINIAMKQYNESKKLPVWDKNTKVQLTVQNYELGKREGRVFKLAGQK